MQVVMMRMMMKMKKLLVRWMYRDVQLREKAMEVRRVMRVMRVVQVVVMRMKKKTKKK
jgi:hypothetical protein